MTEPVDAEGLREALVKGAEYLSRNQRILDNLNVFPVPDGDTGANMVATLDAGIRAIGEGPVSSIAELSERMRGELLRNSRGNSGFIVAWFFCGFFAAAERYDHLTDDCLLEGFSSGAYRVNTSLFTPVEGTMITIIAAMTEALRGCSGDDPGSCLRRAVSAGRETLYKTPSMLPMLAKAGVVDAGALGFIFIVEGMLRSLTREEVPLESEADYRFQPNPRAMLDWTPLPEYRYCTEVYVENPREFDDRALRVFLGERGNSIALVIEGGFIKLHIHTDHPHDILGRLESLGTVAKSKIEDMREQVDLVSNGSRDDGSCAVLACIPGEGFEEVFAGLGVAACLLYRGELPSAGAILDALAEIDAPSVIVLANNANIVPAAMVARDICGRDVTVVPTRNVVEGIAAAYGYSENDSMRENAKNMRDCVGLAACLRAYRSATASTFGDTPIPEGSFFVMAGDDVLAVRDDLADAALEAMKASGAEDKSDVTVYTGYGFDDAVLPRLKAGLSELNPRLSVEYRRGGQPRELLIISIE
ncbi:MAG: DAK2 domain-containing protein [Spirochaetes bacterium]|nr:DAK2 domain-containing protein [Spirochaetota bacterium]MBU1081046.1 DAK2 domain-containing protein [Spirochaetota bacterium]